MEELLNKLIEKGWKPFNVDCAWTNVEVINKIKDDWYIPEHSKIIFKTETHWHVFDCNIRDLVSKGSGLWQFVCENNLNYSEDDSIYNVWLKHYAEDDHESPYTYASPVWYIIESALCDEDKLESFILDNIKIYEMNNVALMRIETFKTITQKCKTWKEYNKRRKKIYHTDGMHYWLHF